MLVSLSAHPHIKSLTCVADAGPGAGRLHAHHEVRNPLRHAKASGMLRVPRGPHFSADSPARGARRAVLE